MKNVFGAFLLALNLISCVPLEAELESLEEEHASSARFTKGKGREKRQNHQYDDDVLAMSCDQKKVILCHVPADESEEPHIIKVSLAAYGNHLDHHGDHLLDCRQYGDLESDDPCPEVSEEAVSDNEISEEIEEEQEQEEVVVVENEVEEEQEVVVEESQEEESEEVSGGGYSSIAEECFIKRIWDGNESISDDVDVKELRIEDCGDSLKFTHIYHSERTPEMRYLYLSDKSSGGATVFIRIKSDDTFEVNLSSNNDGWYDEMIYSGKIEVTETSTSFEISHNYLHKAYAGLQTGAYIWSYRMGTKERVPNVGRYLFKN